LGSNDNSNDRREPFVPSIVEKHHATQKPLDLSLQSEHGLETRFGDLRKTSLWHGLEHHCAVASHHVSHVYQSELEALEFSDWQMEASNVIVRLPKYPSPRNDRNVDRYTASLARFGTQVGKRPRIGLGFGSAAELLMVAGMSCHVELDLIEPRKDLVEAKGKGKRLTYWLSVP
jgi:hypothetical protein